MDEIIVICASDGDGSLFQILIDAIREKSGKAVHIGGPEQSVLTVGEIEIHPASHQVFKAGIEVHLNHGEFAMLLRMACSPDRVFTKEELYAAAWGEEYGSGSTAVENMIWRLRKKLESNPRQPEYIKTIIRVGYKMTVPTQLL